MRYASCAILLPLVLVSLAGEEPAPLRPQVEIVTNHGRIVCELFADQAPLTVANFIGLADGTKAFTDKQGQTVTRPFYDGLIFHRVIPQFMIQGGCPHGNGSGGPGYEFADEINANSLGLDDEVAVLKDGQLHPKLGPIHSQIGQKIILPALAERGMALLPQQRPNQEQMAAIEEEAKKLEGMSFKALFTALGYGYSDELPASTQPRRGVIAMANSGPNTNGSQFFINVVDTPHLTGKHTVFGRVISGMEVVDAISILPTLDQNKPMEAVVIERIRSLPDDEVSAAQDE